MKGFTFRLQKVLDNRERVEDEKKISFVKSKNAYLKEMQKLGELKDELEGYILKPRTNYSSVSEYLIMYNYISSLEAKIQVQFDIVKTREDEMESKKAQFEESRKDRKVLDKLKENAFREFNISFERLEQKQNDEFALGGYVRKLMQNERR